MEDMTGTLTKFSLAALVAAGFAGSALADGDWSGNVAIGTDYVWRGVTQSRGDMAISGGFDYENSIFYAGIWASNVDFGDASDTNVEVDLYGGLASEFAGGVTWDVGVIAYNYPDSGSQDLDFIELYGGLGYAFGSGPEVGASLAWDPDNQNIYAEATAGYSFSDMFTADVSLGNYSFDGGGDYTSYSVGGTLSYEGFDFDLRYWGNDIDTAGLSGTAKDLLGERIVLTLSRSL